MVPKVGRTATWGGINIWDAVRQNVTTSWHWCSVNKSPFAYD